MRRETFEEFLARGGKVEVLPKQEVAEVAIQVPIVNTMPEGRILSLDEGAHYFAENRKVNKSIKKISLKDIVNNYNLPKEIVDRLSGKHE
jgi:hypothetical protein